MINTVLLLSFFISGCSALIYQVSWQRALYGLIGVDMDSITIIVSVFMLGIGLGGMLGGWLSDRFPRQRLRCYAGIELSIALYGGASLWLLQVLHLIRQALFVNLARAEVSKPLDGLKLNGIGTLQ